ncbi:growth arrest-specific protein 8-like isoform X2 [Limulus polyphemus]|uniref:Dynein regulatory complex subunit 4 n=1 Tax=Limulus polyphemus TaxID=6850 RepID=A0ABM1T1C2_LIMPO|nr:growth arrest-specific protein 8-like isoform X2 [Limulus polyphemus]
MPPKKKKGGKKSGKKGGKGGAIIDGVALSDMSKEQIEEHVMRLREELDREREERNFFQLERDKLHTFWEVTTHQLEEKQAELRVKDRELEEAEERHQVEIKVYKQKVKHLMYEHQQNLVQQLSDNSTLTKLKDEQYRQDENVLRGDKRDLKMELREQVLSYENLIKTLKLKHAEEISNLRHEFESKSKEIEHKYEKKMKVLRDELELRRKSEIHDIEERKNQQINNLMKNHDKAFSDIKNYYNDITLNNLALINTLKEQLENMKKKEERLERQMQEITTENRRLSEPLQRAKEEVQELKRQLVSYEKDKISLANTKIRLKKMNEDFKESMWEKEVLEQRFRKVEEERDTLYKKFVSAIQDVQQKAGLKNLLLEKKLSSMEELLEKKETQLSEMLASSNLEPTALAMITRKLERILMPIKYSDPGNKLLVKSHDLQTLNDLSMKWIYIITLY